MTEYYNMNYGGKEVQVESAVRDEEGYSIKGCYAKKTEIKDGTLTVQTNGGSTLGTFSANQSTNQTITLPNGTVQLLNQSVTFDTYTPTQAEIDAGTYAEFPYRASVTVSGISSSTYAEVTYSEEQATSLNFATFIETATDVIYLYSRTNVGTVTIPTISIGMDYSDITIDATPTSGSGNAVSSGGVYTALNDGSVSKLGTSTIGTDIKPIKWVGGVPTAVANDLVSTVGNQDVGGIKTFTSYQDGVMRKAISMRSPTATEITNGTVWFQVCARSSVGSATKMRLRGYSRFDAFECIFAIGGSGDEAGVVFGRYIYRTNTSRRVVIANDTTNDMMKVFINGINSDGSYTLTLDKITDGYNTTSTGDVFQFNYNDTPIAYPTTSAGFSNIFEITENVDVTPNTTQIISGSKTFTSSPTAPNYVMLNRSIVQNANSSAGSMTVNFMGRNSANTNDISRAYIQFYHAPGTSSATSTNLLYMRAYKDDCTNYIDLSLDATNGILGTNGKVSTSQGFYAGRLTSFVCVPSSTYNALKMGTWLEGSDIGAYLEIRASTNGTVSLVLKRMNRAGTVEYNSTTIATA